MNKKSAAISGIKNGIFSIIYKLQNRNTEPDVTEEKEQTVDSEHISRSENKTETLTPDKKELIELKTELGESIEAILNKLFEGISGLLEDEYQNKFAGFERRIDDLEGGKGKERGADFDFTTSKGEYLLSWDSVPGNDSENLIRFLGDEFDISWAEDAEISKSDDDNTICISKDENSAEITIDEQKEKAILKINDGRTCNLEVKTENGKLNLYSEFIASKEEIEKNIEKLGKIRESGLSIVSENDLDKVKAAVETAMFLPKDEVDIPQPFEEEDEDKIIKKILHLSERDEHIKEIDSSIKEIDGRIEKTNGHIEEIKKQLKIESLYRKGISSIVHLGEVKEPYLFSWDSVPGNDSENLIRFLGDEFDISWAEDAEISKSDDDNTICISKDENSAEITIDEQKEKAILKINDGRTCNLEVKAENGKLNLYSEFIASKEEIEKNIEKLGKIRESGLSIVSENDLDKVKAAVETAMFLPKDEVDIPQPFEEEDEDKIIKKILHLSELDERIKEIDGRIEKTNGHIEEIKKQLKIESQYSKGISSIVHIGEVKEPYLFSWDSVPGNDSENLIRFLGDEFDISWAEDAEISKSDDDNTICISKDENSAEITIDEQKEKAILKINDGRTCNLEVKAENGKLNLYSEFIASKEEIEKNIEKLGKIRESGLSIVSENDLDKVKAAVETAMFLPKDKVDIPQPFEEEDEDKIIKKILHLSELDERIKEIDGRIEKTNGHIEEIKKQLKIESQYSKGISSIVHIGEVKEPYLFSWDSVPGNDSENLIRFLGDEFDISWAEDAEISKSDDDNTICISKDENSAEITIDEQKEKAILKINDGRTCNLEVKAENGKLNLYSEFIASKEEIEKNIEKLGKIRESGLSIVSENDLDKVKAAVETAMFLPKDKVDIPQPFEEEDEDKIIKKILHLSELDSHIEEIKKQLKIESLYRKGIALLKKKAYEEARKCFDEITNMDGNLKGAWLNKGFAFGKLGNINKEVECYDGALKIDEHYEKALHNRKIARKKQG